MAQTYEELAQQAEKLAKAGNTHEAIAQLQAALQVNPRSFAGWMQLSHLFYEADDSKRAVLALQQADKVDPLQADFLNVQRALQARDLTTAQSLAEQMAQNQPGHFGATYTLWHLAQARGDFATGVRILKQGLTHAPANLALRKKLIPTLEGVGAFREAIEVARHVTEIDPSFASHWDLLSILFRYGQNDEALRVCERAEAIAGRDKLKQSQVALIKGQILRILGFREKSEAAFRASVADNPLNAAAWWGLADLKTYTFSETEKQALRQLPTHPDLDNYMKSMATFALAKASEGEGDWRSSMALYQQANALRAGTSFKVESYRHATDKLVASFSTDKLTVQAEVAQDQQVPIFIVGMPRSGSTLIEQILASHSEIEGTIEQPLLPIIKQQAHRRCVDQFKGSYLEMIGHLSRSDLSGLGEHYLTENALFRTGQSTFFTDKLPGNFEHIGLIHKILPNAIIIDARRNPLDCGFSLFKQNFTNGADYSYRLSDIGAYYNGYLKIMDHWDRVLPGKVLQVQYEELIQSPEQSIRRLLDHIGVPFEEACLNFHQTQRAVRTASSEQVRQPIYTGSIGLWRQVEPELQVLKDSLGEATLARFRDYL